MKNDFANGFADFLEERLGDALFTFREKNEEYRKLSDEYTALLTVMDGKQLDELEAVKQSPHRFTTMKQLIDYTYNTDYFLHRPSIHDAAALGRYYIYDTGLCQMPEEWKGGIDLEKFGAHAAKQEHGEFTTKGYLMPSGDEWHNRLAEQGIPDEYRLW